MAPTGQKRPYTIALAAVALLTLIVYITSMPFRTHLSSLLNKAEQHLSSPNGAAPPIPYNSKPGHSPTSGQGSAYWSPSFSPSEPASTHFRHETGQHGWGNAEAQNYVSSPANSFHGPNNTLTLRAIIDSSRRTNEEKYTSARLTSHQLLSRPKGCLSATITAPVAKGIWPAFWLLPADPFSWPRDGEVDIFESWDGDAINHSCLHWGFFNGEDWDKHRVMETGLTELTRGGHKFDFAWDENEATGEGRLVWYIDNRAVMKANKPKGTRKLRDFRILANIAVGGNVQSGHMPGNGVYEMQIRELGMWDAPPGGWGGFENAWATAREGHAS